MLAATSPPPPLCSSHLSFSPSVAMPLTASLDGNASSFPPPSPSPGGGDPNDPSHSLPSFAFVIYQLSVLISTLGSTAADTFTRYQLLAAFSNVLSTSINLREVPSSITADGAVHVAAAVAPASSVTSPIPEPPHTPTPPPLPRSNTPSQSPSLTSLSSSWEDEWE